MNYEILKQVLKDYDSGKDINKVDYGIDKNRLGALMEQAKQDGYIGMVELIRVGMDNHVHIIICNNITNKGYELIS
ncbi:hypothetical protein HYH39_06745 [Clostridium botulinum]|nr:hypothetical protein KU40_04580 [Clostridium botulinum]MBY6778638.1 hypothetical protein [Clostridium botulinum]MBY6851817.1 hypothetical protein [Clostridium botulinum]